MPVVCPLFQLPIPCSSQNIGILGGKPSISCNNVSSIYRLFGSSPQWQELRLRNENNDIDVRISDTGGSGTASARSLTDVGIAVIETEPRTAIGTRVAFNAT